MPSTIFQFGDLPWAEIASPLAEAEDGLARLDERLRASPIGEGWGARTHFAEAAASLWLTGGLVDVVDLVLHDAGMEIRAPTDELIHAYAIVRGAAAHHAGCGRLGAVARRAGGAVRAGRGKRTQTQSLNIGNACVTLCHG